MQNDFKTLYEASENARKKQELIIKKQDKYISELTEKNKELTVSYSKLLDEYDHVFSICNQQQELLDQLMGNRSQN